MQVRNANLHSLIGPDWSTSHILIVLMEPLQLFKKDASEDRAV